MQNNERLCLLIVLGWILSGCANIDEAFEASLNCSDDYRIENTQQGITNISDLKIEQLKLELERFNTMPNDDGILYMSELINGVESVQDAQFLKNYIPKNTTHQKNINELLNNNANRPLEERVSPSIWKILHDDSIATSDNLFVVITFIDDLTLPFLQDYNYAKPIDNEENT